MMRTKNRDRQIKIHTRKFVEVESLHELSDIENLTVKTSPPGLYKKDNFAFFSFFIAAVARFKFANVCSGQFLAL